MFESQSEEADCVLIAESRELACHSLLLCPLSPVLAGLQDTRPRKDGKKVVPFNGTYRAALKFLQFCYHQLDLQALQLSAEETCELAATSVMGCSRLH